MWTKWYNFKDKRPEAGQYIQYEIYCALCGENQARYEGFYPYNIEIDLFITGDKDKPCAEIPLWWRALLPPKQKVEKKEETHA